mgnify:CR=1 FL=1
MRFWCQLGFMLAPKNHQNRTVEVSWGVLGASWGVLDASLGVLGWVLGRPGASWARLGRLGGVLGASWGVLGAAASNEETRRGRGVGAGRILGSQAGQYQKTT